MVVVVVTTSVDDGTLEVVVVRGTGISIEVVGGTGMEVVVVDVIACVVLESETSVVPGLLACSLCQN